MPVAQLVVLTTERLDVGGQFVGSLTVHAERRRPMAELLYLLGHVVESGGEGPKGCAGRGDGVGRSREIRVEPVALDPGAEGNEFAPAPLGRLGEGLKRLESRHRHG